VTADHGMAPQDVALRANPARHVSKLGLASEVAEPMIWLLDLAVEVERASDGRTARVCVWQNERTTDGERPPLAGAEVQVVRERAGAEPEPIAHGRTGGDGIFGFPTPAEVSPHELLVSVPAEGFNQRRLRLDGSSCVLDLRRALYGED